MNQEQRDALNDLHSDGWAFHSSYRNYQCGYCGVTVSTRQGLLFLADRYKGIDVRLCSNCRFATNLVFDAGDITQLPDSCPGQEFPRNNKDDDLDSTVNLYDQARRSMRERAYSAAVLLFRKLLMHIAVGKEAATNKPFAYYCDYLKTKNIVGMPQYGMLDRIKDRGNQENHEIRVATKEDATELLTLVAHLLQSIYFME